MSHLRPLSDHAISRQHICQMVVESREKFDLRSLHLLVNDDKSLTLKVMIKAEGNSRWQWLEDSSLHANIAIFLASSLVEAHGVHYPERQKTASSWVSRLMGSEVPTRGISLMMGMDD